jgi:hypothetical protein
MHDPALTNVTFSETFAGSDFAKQRGRDINTLISNKIKLGHFAPGQNFLDFGDVIADLMAQAYEMGREDN